MIEEEKLAQIITDWNLASYGNKTEVIRRWSKVYGVGYNTLYRAISQSRLKTRKHRSDKGKRTYKEIEKWTQMIWQIKYSPPSDSGIIATDQAFKLALSEGIIPPEASKIPVSTYNRIAREIGLNPGVGRFSRFQAKYPNLLHQFDASSSKFFYVDRRLPDGERILKIHRGAKYYKNKPVPIRERPWVYGLVDDYSGYHVCQYTTAEGESAVDGLLFLQYAWGKKKNSRIPFRGLPRLLYMDNGVMSKTASVKDFLKRLDIVQIPRMPYKKEAGGKIERPWRTLWKRFELTFFIRNDWETFEITLTELNRQLNNYLIEYNSWSHRYQKDISREQAWLQISLRGGVVDIPSNALNTVFRRKKHTVRGGYLTHNGINYEVPDLDNGKVWVYEGVFDDRLVVVDMKNHQKYEVKLFEPILFGQRAEEIKSEVEKLVQENQDKIFVTKPYYEKVPDTNIINLPVSGKEQKLEDPLKLPEIKGLSEEEDEEERLFLWPRERYEWLLERRSNSEVLPEEEIKFMKEFESTDLYKQLAETYRKWELFWKSRAAV
jgi:transposase InsO family protein